jgi:ferredoxin-NADP reductase/Na+-transporting NADH:ubiquinone oxidoreductase subunit NqrB
MTNYLDYFVDRITMYRLVLYYLVAIIAMGLVLSFLHALPYTPLSILSSCSILLLVCWTVNRIFSWAFNVPTSFESSLITALILACIVPPLQTIADLKLIVWAGVLAMASKYILALYSKHVFNPAAIAVVLTGFWLHLSASWWVGTALMAPVILIGGILIVHKIRKYYLVVAFFAVSLVTISVFTQLSGGDIQGNLKEVFLHSPLLFFAFVMLTEPQTTPPSTLLYVLYGAVVGFLFAPQVHVGSVYSTPELALVIGNIFSYIVSPKVKERLALKSQTPAAAGVVSFSLSLSRPFSFQPGQYLEFTVPHTQVDGRGNRRYFTIASSPTEETLLLGIKFYENSSSFKRSLLALTPGQAIMGSQLAGEFVLPKDPAQKLVFVAGGIGVTPFRSMAKYLTDTQQQRDIVILYANKTADEIAYGDIFTAAAGVGVRTVYTLTGDMPEGWTGRTGRINEEMVQQEIPDFKERLFYISGPHTMVSATDRTLQKLGVKQSSIKKDFFPGLA